MTNKCELMTSMKNEIANMNMYDLYTNTLSENTKANYVSTIKQFFGVNDLNDIRISDIQSVTPEIANLWAQRLLLEGNTKATINRKMSAMHNFYKFLCRRNVGVMDYNPFSTDEGAIRFKNATRDYSDKRILSPVEISKMYREARKDETIFGIRDLLILQLLSTTGMRRAEICSIKVGDIKVMGGQRVIQITGKGDKQRLIVIAKPIYELIKKYLRKRKLTILDKDEPLIVSHSVNSNETKPITPKSIYSIVKKYAKLAGIDESSISPHCLRATYATLAYGELDMSKDELKELMGHKSASTTNRYVKTTKILKNNPADRLEAMFDCQD